MSSAADDTNSSSQIAAVLFIDIVGFSRLVMDEQAREIRQLADAVRNAEEFKRADAAGRLVILPSGDGMALVFFDHPEAALRCALEISRALKDESAPRLRFGINSGPIVHIADINTRANVAGAGISDAQRVMDCGDAGHILVTKSVVDELGPSSPWKLLLHDVGEATLKHGVIVQIFNLFTDEIGNAETPHMLRREVTPGYEKGARSGLTESPEKERLAIIFVDVVGSTSLNVEMGDLAFANVREEFFKRSFRLIQAYNGRLIKTIGDSYMATFPTAAAAVEFAVRLHHSLAEEPIDVAGRRFSIRVGVHLGDVNARETSYGGDIFGEAVNFAARLIGVARADEVVVSEAARRSLTKELSDLLGPTEYHEIKGFPNAAEISRLTLGGA